MRQGSIGACLGVMTRYSSSVAANTARGTTNHAGYALASTAAPPEKAAAAVAHLALRILFSGVVTDACSTIAILRR